MIISQSIGLEWSAGKMLEFGLYAALLRNLVLKEQMRDFHLKKKTAARNILSFEGGFVLIL